jgi:hypothetical protein
MAMIRRKRCRRPRGWLGSGRLWTSAVTGIVAAVVSANARPPAPPPSPPPPVERPTVAAPSPPPDSRLEIPRSRVGFDTEARLPLRIKDFARPRWPDGPFDR